LVLGLAITDHHTVGGYRSSALVRKLEVKPPLGKQRTSPLSVEINANLLGIEVHILGCCFDQHTLLAPYLQRQAASGGIIRHNVIAAIHRAGTGSTSSSGSLQAIALELVPAVAELGIDGIETYYATIIPTLATQPNTNKQMQELAAIYGTLNTMWH